MAARIIWFLIVLSITNLALSTDGTKHYDDNENKVLLDSYIPAAMQLLAYHLELLKHETLSSTTIEPPFYGDSNALNNDDNNLTGTYNHNHNRNDSSPHFNRTEKPWLLEVTTKKVNSTTTEMPWWSQSATKKKTSSTTETPWSLETTKRISTLTTTTQKLWWVPTTTKKIMWWSPPSTTPTPHRTTTMKMIWWSPLSTTQKPPRTTTRKIDWSIYLPSTTQNSQRTSTKKFWWLPLSTTRKPERTTPNLNQVETTTFETPTTSKHPPGIFAPTHNSLKNRKFRSCSNTPVSKAFRKPKSVRLKLEYDLDPLPVSLVKDLNDEDSQLLGESDGDNVKAFLKRYDDSYRSPLQTAGKKKVPPAKPYVEFLILFDLIKRDAKAAKLENYEGYSKKMEEELYLLSSRSSEVQLYYVLKRMLAGHNGVLRDDVVTRVSNIIKDLENPNSQTVKNLRYIPPLKFIL